MASDAPFIKAVTVESFRGFLEPKTVLLDASATIVTGPNGSGKTSFFDAVQWLMLGRIERLAALASRRSGDYVVSSFAPPGQQAVVSAELQVKGDHVVLRREGTARENVLTWNRGSETLTDDDAANELAMTLLGDSELTLKDVMLTSGLLQQDVVRAVLEDQPKDRYRQMAGMLGLTDVAGFEDAAKALADRTRKEAASALEDHEAMEARVRAARMELERLEQRLVSQAEFQHARTALAGRLEAPGSAINVESLPAAASDAVALGQWARRVRNGAAELLRDDEALAARDAAAPTIDRADLDRARTEESAREAAVHTEQARLEHAQQRYDAARERASRLAELAAIALPLLAERCPVCEQPIEEARVAEHLHALTAREGDDLAALSREVSDVTASANAAAEARATASARRAEAEAAVRETEALAANRRQWLERCEQLAAEGGERLAPNVRAQLVSGGRAALEATRDSADVLAGVADELAALLGASGLSEELSRQHQELARLEASVAATRISAAEHSARAAEAKTLGTAATEAIAGVARRRFATLQPLLDDIFRRLDPHPVFRSLGFDLTVSYRSGVADPFVLDPEGGVTGDPLLVFSSSQANAAALTYFLAVSWAAGAQALPFLLLDDPLQSMDDVNALAFADLCRHVRGRRQLLISTHDRRLSALLERKLMPRGGERTRVIRFIGWDRSGPRLQQEDIIGPEGAGFLLEAK